MSFSVEYDGSNLTRIADLYSQNGFVLVDNVFSIDEAVEMKREANKIVDALDLDSAPKSVFTTEDANRAVYDFTQITHSLLYFSTLQINISWIVLGRYVTFMRKVR